eukprot:scaffold19753_cov231-Amphora_coffeaeformis.AAC.1
MSFTLTDRGRFFIAACEDPSVRRDQWFESCVRWKSLLLSFSGVVYWAYSQASLHYYIITIPILKELAYHPFHVSLRISRIALVTVVERHVDLYDDFSRAPDVESEAPLVVVVVVFQPKQAN